MEDNFRACIIPSGIFFSIISSDTNLHTRQGTLLYTDTKLLFSVTTQKFRVSEQECGTSWPHMFQLPVMCRVFYTSSDCITFISLQISKGEL
jgi:hypothetical protein